MKKKKEYISKDLYGHKYKITYWQTGPFATFSCQYIGKDYTPINLYNFKNKKGK